MFVSNLELVQHILVETSFILNHTGNKTKVDVLSDEVLWRAVMRSIVIIGEASKKIDDVFKSIHQYIEWKKMAGTKDKLIHDYFGIDYDIVWDIIENKFPDLDHFLRQII